MVADFRKTLDEFKVPSKEQEELIAIVRDAPRRAHALFNARASLKCARRPRPSRRVKKALCQIGTDLTDSDGHHNCSDKRSAELVHRCTSSWILSRMEYSARGIGQAAIDATSTTEFRLRCVLPPPQTSHKVF
jgi:hypothetical protein